MIRDRSKRQARPYPVSLLCLPFCLSALRGSSPQGKGIMSKKSVPGKSAPFEYVLFEGDDADEMRTVIATPNETSPWINPPSLKLRHRIGRGPFGDIWLATHHQSTEDYDEYHEVAVKMLSLMREANMKTVLDKLNDNFAKLQTINGVCRLLGFSIINEKISIIMKFYDGSVGDKMAKLKGGKLPLPDILRYGISLARAVMEVHSAGILVLNLKPSNFLLDENDKAILGDVGVPFLLLGISLSDFDTAHHLGTPNYMAPEQWEPEVRGPISFETDSWGYGCSILEMLTGSQPWSGKSVQQIYRSVVINKERPQIPCGLPPAVRNVLSGCFEYDFRNRPRMKDIIIAFLSSQEEVSCEDMAFVQDNTITAIRPTFGGYTEWFVSKDELQECDVVRSRKAPNSYKPKSMAIPEGKIVGFGSDDDSSHVLVKVHGIHSPLRVHRSTLERVSYGFSSGDWVRVREEKRHHSPVGILHSVDRDGMVTVAFIGLETLWKGKFSDLQMAESYCVGQFVRLKQTVFSPRFEWPHKNAAGEKGAWATGKITQVLPNGCLVVKFPGRFVLGEKQSDFLADPAEVELVSFSTASGLVQKYQHLEDFHWAIRPLVIAMGLFTAMKVGIFVGKKVRSRGRNQSHGGNAASSKDGDQVGANASGNSSAWLPPSVTSMIQGKC